MREAGVDLRHPRGLLLGAARAGEGRVRPSAGSTRSWTCCTPAGIAVDLATATASPPPWLTAALPRDPAGRPRRAHAVAGQPAGVVPSSPVYREQRARARRPPRRRGTRPPGAGDVARLQRATAATTRPATATPAPAPSALAARRYGDLDAPQRRVGHRVLEPALHRLGRDPAAAADHDASPTRPSARLPPVLLGRAARLLPRRARRARASSPRRPGHDQLHDARPLPACRLPRWAPEPGRGLHRPLPGRRPDPPARRAGAAAPTSPAGSPAGAPGCSWSTRPARSTGSRATSPRRPAAADPQQPRPRRPRRRRARLLPVARSRGRARRSSTRRWCRTPAPTAPVLARGRASSAPIARPARRGARQHGSRPEVALLWDYEAAWARRRAAHAVGSASTTRPPRDDRAPAAACTGRHRRRRAPGRRPGRLPAWSWCRRSTSSTDAQRRMPCATAAEAGGHVLVTYFSGIVDERRPRPARRLPRGVPRPARRPRRGVLPAAGGASTVRAVRRRLRRASLDRGRSAGRRRGGRDLRDGPAGRPPGGHPARRRRRAWPGTSAPASTTRALRRPAATGWCAEAGVQPAAGVPAGVEAVRRRRATRELALRAQPHRRAPRGRRPRATTWSPAAGRGECAWPRAAASPWCGRT